MKTLQEYILEAIDKDMFLDFVQKSFNIKNGDYEEPYNIIKNKNYKQMLNDFCKNKNISPEIIIKLEDFTNLSEFINTLVNLNKGEKLLNINDLENNDNDNNIFNLVKDTLFKDETYKDDKEFLKVLTNISKFKVNAGKTAKGRFEYFLYFFLNGERDNKYQIGDVIIKNNDDSYTQIEVKYCKDANFKPYNSGSLSKSSIENIKECDNEDVLVNFLLDCLINKDINNNIDSNKKLIKHFVEKYLEKNNKNIEDIKNLDVEDIKNFIGTCQFYLYLHNELEKEIDNKYLILFHAASENSENYGDYILLDVNKILKSKSSVKEIIDFSSNNFKWGAIHRNAIQFTLKK